MATDYEQAMASPRAGPDVPAPAGSPAPATSGSAHPRPASSGWRAGAAAQRLILPATDLIGLIAAAAVSGLARGLVGSFLVACYIIVVLAVLAADGQHRIRICLRASDQAGRILIAAVVPAIALLAWRPETSVLWLALWSAGLVFAGRSVLCTVLRALHRRGRLTEPAIIVGAGTFGAYVAEVMQQHPEFGLEPKGLLDGGPPRLDLAVPTLGGPADLADVTRRLGIQRVILSFSSDVRDEELVGLLRASQQIPADVYVIPRLYELGMAVPRGCLDEIWGIPLIRLRRVGNPSFALALKRAFDVVVSTLLLVAAAPLIFVLALAVRLRTGQGVLFRQARVTGQGRLATIVKLRTLAAHDDHDTRWTAAEHSSSLGRWLRSTHLDELPQLVNVMRGDMSLVGPRPERPHFAERFSREVPRYENRNRMPAGVTGWAQVNGLNGDTSIFERARFDNYYLEYWSVWMDLAILVRTLATVIRGGRQVKS
jgi:exopolysaccharide biosynthesis polyprenyl glycosylphosphotransferase